MTKPCIFCGKECIFDEDDEGRLGTIIGDAVICGGCEEELKSALGIDVLENMLYELEEELKK